MEAALQSNRPREKDKETERCEGARETRGRKWSGGVAVVGRLAVLCRMLPGSRVLVVEMP